jgi:heme A synthase
MSHRISADEDLAAREQMADPAAQAWRLALWPLAGLAYLVVVVSGGGLRRSRQAARACRSFPRGAPVTRRAQG